MGLWTKKSIAVLQAEAAGESTEHTLRRALGALIWTLQIASAAMFLFSGTLKLSGAPMMVQMFAAIGVGQWFRFFTGSVAGSR